MTSDFESAFRQMLKSVIREVAVELLNEQEVEFGTQARQNDSLLLRTRDAAERLGVSEAHLHRLTRSGVLPCVRVGQCVRYSVETIEQWIRDSESTTPPVSRRASTTTSEKTITTASKSVTKSPKTTRKPVEPRVRPKVPKPKVPKKPTEPVSGPRQKAVKAEEPERPNPFRLFLKEIGVNPSKVPTMTNGALMQIAEVDIPTLHGWMYLGRSLPEEALEKLRQHFSKFRTEGVSSPPNGPRPSRSQELHIRKASG